VPPSIVALPVDVDVVVAVAVEADPEPPEAPDVDPEAPEVPAVDPEPPEAPEVPEVDVLVDVPVEVTVFVGGWVPDAEPLLSFEVEPHAVATAVTSTTPETGKRRMMLKDPRARGGKHARSSDHSSNQRGPESRFGIVWRERGLSVCSDGSRRRSLAAQQNNVQPKCLIAVWPMVNASLGAILRWAGSCLPRSDEP
jgi:hypothetical protein